MIRRSFFVFQRNYSIGGRERGGKGLVSTSLCQSGQLPQFSYIYIYIYIYIALTDMMFFLEVLKKLLRSQITLSN